MKLFVCLLSLVTAADISGDDTASDSVQSDNGYGYEAPETESAGYAAPVATAYAAPVATAYAAPVPAVHYKAPRICYSGGCKNGCYNRETGACVPKACASHVATYAVHSTAVPSTTVPSTTYGGEENYGEDAGYGGEDADAGAAYGGEEGEEQGDSRRLQYDDAVYPHNHKCGCPAGTVDTHKWSMHSQTVFWVGFGFLFAPALCFLWKAFDDLTKAPYTGANGISGDPAKQHALTEVRLNAGFVNMIASLAYLAMATKHGFTTRCDGKDFYYARYVDWILTTPLMLWDLTIVAGANDVGNNTKYFLAGLDIIMIVSGLIGSLVAEDRTGEKWGFFGFSMLCFIPIIYYLCALEGGSRFGHCEHGFCGASHNVGTDARKTAYQRAMYITTVTWICYPIIWILAEGTSKLSVTGENIAYTVLDIIAKSFFGWVIVFMDWWRTGAHMIDNGSSAL